MQKSDFEKILNNYDWDFSNNILYKLCSDCPTHTVGYEVLAKIFFIGRTYAAAIERRKNKKSDEIGDNFYVQTVVPTIIISKLDEKLFSINQYLRVDENNFCKILEVHKYLSDLFKELTKLEKRSLSSKYLHFHKPNLFFIYDSRVSKALSSCLPKARISKEHSKLLKEKNIDKTYARFLIKSLALRNKFEEILKRQITLREYDKILIHFANNKIKHNFT
ncbi:MAG: hypothetical protein KF721_14270 [Ignavibacteriaceae bacterium]|nr:hypothetical protein [Ignavibacteriaceae bacterium]